MSFENPMDNNDNIPDLGNIDSLIGASGGDATLEPYAEAEPEPADLGSESEILNAAGIYPEKEAQG